MSDVRATAITDAEWLHGRLELARRLYGPAPARVLGTVWWYSASSVLVAPPLESLVASGVALDPALDAITLRIQPDGRLLGAASSRPFAGDVIELGAAYGAALRPAISCVAEACGARERSLWAIAADSIGNRLLWAGQAAGDVERAIALAGPLAEGIGDVTGEVMPRPRFLRVGPHTVVRRVSCCLIDKATGQEKCTSCPNQHPDVRTDRIRAALGA
ncbi:MAG: Fe-S oxidoreductase [Actinophytocola sp.]|nr:Fe-S oxidoreductase [Actinophytocola sp.]